MPTSSAHAEYPVRLATRLDSAGHAFAGLPSSAGTAVVFRAATRSQHERDASRRRGRSAAKKWAKSESAGGSWRQGDNNRLGRANRAVMKPSQEATEVKVCRPNSAMGFYLAMGAAIGAAVGAAVDNVAMGVAFGVGLGAALGAFVNFSRRADRSCGG
jgi:hypothetical protein